MALLFTVLLAVSAAILCYFLIDFGKRDFLRETEAAIDIEINMLSDLEKARNDFQSYIQQRTLRDQSVRFRYENPGGAWLGGTINPMPDTISRIAEGVISFPIMVGDEERIFAAKIHTFEDGNRVIVARNVHDLVSSYERLKHLSYLIMLLMLSVVVVSFGISYFVVTRIDRIAHIAQNIVETGDLSQRISVDSHWDDLSNLSEVLNGFLDKMEVQIDNVREVSNNIAHDLRTPLSGLRNDIELLKNEPVQAHHIDTLLSTADRILAIFQAILRIATLEKGTRTPLLQPADISVILKDVIELYEPVAEEKNIILKLETASVLKVRGDSDLLFQLFANLIDNAVKFSPDTSRIDVHAYASDETITVTVKDQGPGIPDEEKDNVFRHFYRGDSSRTHAGNGLGLSLVKAITEAHKAEISLEDTNPGLCIRLSFQPYQ